MYINTTKYGGSKAVRVHTITNSLENYINNKIKNKSIIIKLNTFAKIETP